MRLMAHNKSMRVVTADAYMLVQERYKDEWVTLFTVPLATLLEAYSEYEEFLGEDDEYEGYPLNDDPVYSLNH